MVTLILLTTAMAGCFGGDDAPPTRTATASGGAASDGYAYDGEGIVSADATLSATVNEDEETGSINASFEAWNSTWTVRFDQFSETADFMDGGIVFDILEHGDTGVSSPAIPAIMANVAAWGSADVTRDGEAYDPQGNEGRWSAHLMLSDDTVRGPDGLITKADGTTPYDPSTPEDARTIEDDRQAILTLTAPSGAESAREAVAVEESFQFQGPNNRETVEFPTAPHSQLALNIVAEAASGAGAGNFTYRLVDANGTEIDAGGDTVTPTGGLQFAPEVTATTPTTLILTGSGAYEVTVEATVTYDDHPDIVLFWQDWSEA